MPRKTTKQKALEHYNRMIAWAEKQPKSEYADIYLMREQIGEYCYSDDCAYCQKYYNIELEMCKCKLHSKVDEFSCCNGLWFKMANSTTWSEWIKFAKKVREYIEING